jgi:NitT/TauT family transport system permease protein
MAIDVLEAPTPVAAPRRETQLAAKIWPALWPKLVAVAIFIGGWQALVWSGWRPEYIVPSPFTVFDQLFHDLSSLNGAIGITMRRAGLGFGLAILIGGVIGLAVARVKVLRTGIGSMITGLQTMPSVAWVPLAIVLFQLSERAILFVTVLGAAPSIANGIIDGIDNVPPVLLRAGRVLGARGFTALRYVVIPAALPSVVSGLKQGWAFAWRSLMAAELIGGFPGHLGIAQKLNVATQNADYPSVYEAMIVIFVIGVVVDVVFFGTILRAIRKRYGLIDAAA